MWLMTTYGFFSIVRKAENEFHLRGRIKQDVERLRTAAGLTAPVLTSEAADYRYRLVISAEDLHHVMDLLARSITYPNFKDQIGHEPDQRGKLPSYHRIWEIMSRLQR